MAKKIMLCCLIFIVCTQVINAQTWQKRRIDRGQYDEAGIYCSIAVDGKGYSHISYQDRNNNKQILKYAYEDNYGWHIEEIDFTKGYTHVGFFSDIALDSEGNPHIVEIIYNTYSNDLIRYLHKGSGGVWISEDFTNYDFYKYCKIQIGSDDNPHILYGADKSGCSGFNLVRTQKNNGSWSSHIITNDLDYHMNWDQITGLTLDENNNPIVCYFSDGSLMLSRDGSSKTIDSNCGRGKGCAIDYDSQNDVVWIVYHNWNKDILSMAMISSGNIDLYSLDNLGGKHPSIELDKYGNPHIAYYTGGKSTQQHLRYIYRDSKGWYRSTVDQGYDGSGGSGGNFHNISLGVSLNDCAQAYICYQWCSPSGGFGDYDYHLHFAKNIADTKIEVLEKLPNEFILEQNYPNPFVGEENSYTN